MDRANLSIDVSRLGSDDRMREMSARAWTCFAAVSVLWGVPYLFIKLAVDEVDPGVRGVVARGARRAGAPAGRPARRRAARAGRRVRWLAAYALAEIVIPFPLIAVGEATSPRRWPRSSSRPCR